jgi:hypothetical protein
MFLFVVLVFIVQAPHPVGQRQETVGVRKHHKADRGEQQSRCIDGNIHTTNVQNEFLKRNAVVAALLSFNPILPIRISLSYN